MKKLRQFKGKLSLLLILAILVLCAGFFIVSCGNKPQQKTENTNKGAFAIDFSKCPNDTCAAIPKGSEVTPIPDISNRQITLEAWVKVGAATSTPLTIFKRNDGSAGVELLIENNVPKFKINRVPVTGTEAFTVSSDVTLDIDTWYHIAGLISSADTHTPTSTAMTETPHLDIYINGEYKNSATTNSNFADNPANEDISIGPVIGGVIDELRIWGSRRTDTEINNCMNTELGIGGVCDRGDPYLAAYYRLNEGEGADIADFSGNGFSGGFEYVLSPGVFPPWEDGWVTPGAPITPAD
jgi:hypothetical protein